MNTKDNSLILKNKIKVLEQQIEQKNNVLIQIKTSDIKSDDKLKALKSYHENKIKTLNLSIIKLKEENKVLKNTNFESPKEKNQYHLPKLYQNGNSKNIRNASADSRLNRSAINKKTVEKDINVENGIGEVLDVVSLSKELEILKEENDKLKLKYRQTSERLHQDLNLKEKELLELRKIKIELNILNEKYEIISKKTKITKTQERNNVPNSEIENLSKKMDEIDNKLKITLSENSVLKDEIKKYKSKLSSLTTQFEKEKQIQKLDVDTQYSEEDFRAIDETLNELREETHLLSKQSIQKNEELDKNSQGQGKVANLHEFEGDMQGQGTEENEPASSKTFEKKEATSKNPIQSEPTQNKLRKSVSINRNRKSTDKKEVQPIPSNTPEKEATSKSHIQTESAHSLLRKSASIKRKESAPKQNQPVISPKIIFVLGGPGSGKGTQCAMLKEKFDFLHISTGDVLREQKKANTPISQEIEGYIKEGKLVPSKILIDLLNTVILDPSNRGKIILLDGFPRNFENYEVWKTEMGVVKVEFKFLLFFECSNQTLENRILERAKSSGRSDDNPEALKKRITTYENETKPILELFEKEGKVVKIDAEVGKEEIFESVVKVLGEHGLVEGRKEFKKLDFFYY